MDREELIEQLEGRLNHWQPHMCMGGCVIRFEPIEKPFEGAWSFLTHHDDDDTFTLEVHPQLPEELWDYVIVHAIAEIMTEPLWEWALEAADTAPHPPYGSARANGAWRRRDGIARERVVQRITQAVVHGATPATERWEEPFLVEAWFAMLLFEDW